MKANGFHGKFRQSMAWLHTWSGLVLSLILYFVFITGTFGYFNSEIDHWMQPEAPGDTGGAEDDVLLRLGLDYLRREAPDATRHFVALPGERDSKLVYAFANLQTPAEDGSKFLRTYLDPGTGQPARLRDTGGGDALYRMHYALHYMPYEVAIYIVGMATLFMLLAIVTGIVVHKKIFVDFFTLRLGKGQRSWLDSHNISSVLALPFMLMITYSGLVFYTFDYSPGVALLSMGSDEAARNEMMAAHLRPGFERSEPSGVAAPMIDIGTVLAVARVRWPDNDIRFVNVEHPGDRTAQLTIGKTMDSLTRRGSNLRFDAVTGELLDALPPMPADVVFADVMLAMHEGRFANYGLRWLYFLSGLLGAAMVATGLLLWAKKRRTRLQQKTAAPRSLIFVERSNLGIIVGLPLGIAAYFWVNRLLPAGLENRAEWEMHSLFIVWALSFAHAGARELKRAWREQVGLLAALFLLLPLLNAITSEAHLGVSLRQGDWVRASFDGFAFAFGAALCLVWRRLTPARVPLVVAGADEAMGRAATASKAGV